MLTVVMVSYSYQEDHLCYKDEWRSVMVTLGLEYVVNYLTATKNLKAFVDYWVTLKKVRPYCYIAILHTDYRLSREYRIIFGLASFTFISI